ncbi:uncharacterized protein At4g22758 [Beta vulgaris subsp. vulgaris]|uniref:uncharacterized protein At4g22758 n=1 Tax=Beta vulgaris subsp. vulgaris TaxID=3555 RepID=UPI002036FD65|nr:uncharacterized protein At4g22758 [Beta vulgaris subsp. vulgaris]
MIFSSEKQKSSIMKKSNCFDCHKENINNNKRFLIIVNVLGSAGPLKFVVNEEDLVGGVIEIALKIYDKEGRLPALGSDNTKFLIYCANAGSDALSPWDEIGSCGSRNFVLCKKPEQQPNMTESRSHLISRKRSANWKSWFNKSLSFKISSH